MAPQAEPDARIQVSQAAADDRQGAAPRFAVQVSDAAVGVVVRLEGEADLAAMDRMQFALMRLIARRTPRAVLDLSALTSLCSLAMGALVRLRRDLNRWGGRVLIAGVQPGVYEALQVAALISLFEFYTTVEEATTAG
jgi:anti-anti-sigma factor